MAAPKNMSDGQMLCERKIYSSAWQLGTVVVHQMKKHEEEVKETLSYLTSHAPVLQKLQRNPPMQTHLIVFKARELNMNVRE